jgi:co-chaperonin GroES (HSP10)
MRVLNDQIAVKQVEAQAVTEGGIVIPEMSQRATSRGLVVSVGPGRAPAQLTAFASVIAPKPQISAGDLVVFMPNVGYEATIDGTRLLFLREDHILAVLDPPAPAAAVDDDDVDPVPFEDDDDE